jgi:hypothetical protein
MDRLIYGLALLAFSSALFAANAPSTFMGQRVREVTYKVLDGQSITLHAIPAGPIPEQTSHFRLPLAGPFFEQGHDGKPARYHWGYAIEFLDTATPTHLVIEDVTGKTALPLVDDAAPALKAEEMPTWNGDAAECEIRRDNPCSGWLFADSTQRFILRVTAQLSDGSTDTLYQAIQFEPMQLRPMLDAMGVAR